MITRILKFLTRLVNWLHKRLNNVNNINETKGLIKLKKESLRPKDQIDVQTLQSLMESNTNATR